MKYLDSNQELYDYMVSLSTILKSRGANDSAQKVIFASNQASSMSAEFIGEARIALKFVLNDEKKVLSISERDDIESILRQLNAAIHKWPQRKP